VPDARIRITRATSVVFAAGIVTLLFIVGRRVSGTAAGLIAVLLLLGHPSFTMCVRRGLTDSILMFHLTLIVPLTLASAALLQRHWQEKRSGGPVRRWSVLLLVTVLAAGTTVALAAGSKLNGALAGPSYVGGLVLAALLCTSTSPLWRRLALVSGISVLTAVVAVALFVAFNPYYHHDPFKRMAGVLDIWSDWMNVQQIIHSDSLFTIHQKITAAGYYSLCHASLPLSRLLETLHVGALSSGLTVLCFVVGLVYLASRCLPPPREIPQPRSAAEPADDRSRVDAAVVLCWVIVCTVGITMWLPLLWDRHLLPIYLTVSLTTAVGLAALPHGAMSIAALVVGTETGRRARRIAFGSLSVALAWIVLALTTWVITPMLLPDLTVWDDPAAFDADHAGDPNAPLFHDHTGVIFMHLGMNEEAADQFQSALSLIENGVGDRASAALRRCRRREAPPDHDHGRSLCAGNIR
jgi:hypothetical protein